MIWFQLLIGFVIFVGLVHFVSNQMIFQPPRPATYQTLEHLVFIPNANGPPIAAVYFKHPDAKKTILFSHGNAEDLGTMYAYIKYLSEQGFSVLAYDYPGYGLSKGKPTESSTYQAIFAVYDYLVEKEKVDPQSIIAFGRSLGSGPSIELATRKPLGGLILESAFTSAYRVMTTIGILPLDKYNNIQKIKSIQIPTLVIHAQSDEIIPFWHGRKLFEKSGSTQKMYFWVAGAGHNDIVEHGGEAYWEKIREFVELY